VHSDSFTINDSGSTTGTQVAKVATLSTYAREKLADKHMPKERLEMNTRIPESSVTSSTASKKSLYHLKSIFETSVDTTTQQKAPQSSYHALMKYWTSTPDGEANLPSLYVAFILNLSSGADVNMLTHRIPRALSTHRFCFDNLRSLLTAPPSCFRTRYNFRCQVLAAPKVPWPSGPSYKPQGGM
jgi:hypothetical protein